MEKEKKEYNEFIDSFTKLLNDAIDKDIDILSIAYCLTAAASSLCLQCFGATEKAKDQMHELMVITWKRSLTNHNLKHNKTKE